MKDIQTWLNENYSQEQRADIQKLAIVLTEKLEGRLDLRDFVNLEALRILGTRNNPFRFSNCPKLTRIFCPRNLFDEYASQIEENAKVKYRQEFRSVGGRAATASNQEIDEWFNKFSFDRIYLENPFIVQPTFRLFTVNISNLTDYLKPLPSEIEVAFGKSEQAEEVVGILWRGFQVRNLPPSLKNQWEQTTIKNVGELRQWFNEEINRLLQTRVNLTRLENQQRQEQQAQIQAPPLGRNN